MFRFECLFFIIAVASAGNINFKDCGNNELSEIRINHCDGNHCNLQKGSDVHIEVDFTANEDSETATIDMKVSSMGITIHIPVINHNACNNGHLTCPLKKGEKYTAKYDTIVIPMIIPHIENVHIDAKLFGDNNTVLACAEMIGNVN